MLINLSCLPLCFARIVSYGRSPYQSVFILKPFTVTINELCHDSSVCFLLFLLLFLRQLSVDLHVIMVRSTSCLLTCLLLYVVRIFILFLLASVLVFCLSVTSSLTSLILLPLAIKAARISSLYVSSARPTAQLQL
jgi:hypothetical protein